MLADAGIMMLQQGPLLKGINDDTEVLKELYEQLALQVIPYYAAWGLTVPGAEHFVVDGPTAYAVVGALENQTSGFCIPHVITLRQGDKVRTLGWRDGRGTPPRRCPPARNLGFHPPAPARPLRRRGDPNPSTASPANRSASVAPRDSAQSNLLRKTTAPVVAGAPATTRRFKPVSPPTPAPPSHARLPADYAQTAAPVGRGKHQTLWFDLFGSPTGRRRRTVSAVASTFA